MTMSREMTTKMMMRLSLTLLRGLDLLVGRSQGRMYLTPIILGVIRPLAHEQGAELFQMHRAGP